MQSYCPIFIRGSKQCEHIINNLRVKVPNILMENLAILIKDSNCLVLVSDTKMHQDDLLKELSTEQLMSKGTTPLPKERRYLRFESDLFVDYIEKFGDHLKHECKSSFGVDLILRSTKLTVEGTSTNDVERCKTLIEENLSKHYTLVQLPACDLNVASTLIQSVTKSKECCWKLHSLTESSENSDMIVEFQDPYGTFQLCVKSIHADIKTDLCVLLTTDTLFIPANGFVENVILQSSTDVLPRQDIGMASYIPVNEIRQSEHINFRELWIIVCAEMKGDKVAHVTSHKKLRKALATILDRAEQMHYLDICIYAPLVDNLGSHLQVNIFAKILVAGAKSSFTVPSKRVVDIRMDKAAKHSFYAAFQENYKVYKSIPRQYHIKASSFEIELLCGKIQEARVQVIVCPSDSDLTFNGQSAKALLEMVGDKMQQDCRKKYPNGIPSFTVAYTTSHGLKSRGVQYVFHIALPKYNCFQFRKVKDVVKRCLYLADELECPSIAFPALGVGALKYPRRETAFLMYEGFREYKKEGTQSKLKNVQIICFEKDDATSKAFVNEIRKRSSQPKIDAAKRTHYEVSETYIGQGSKIAVRVMLGDNLCIPTYAVIARFHYGQFSFKGASENSTTNDQLNLPVSIEDDPEHGIRLIEEERITHLILTLDSKTVPDTQQEQMALTLLEAFAISRMAYLRIVDVILPDLPRVNRFLSYSGFQWMSVFHQNEPSVFLELMADSKECLEEIRSAVEKSIFEEVTIPIAQSYRDPPLNPSFDTSLADLKQTDDNKTHVSDGMILNASNDNKFDPLYATIDEIDPHATFRDHTAQCIDSTNTLIQNKDGMDDDSVHTKLDENKINSAVQTQIDCLPYTTVDTHSAVSTIPVNRNQGIPKMGLGDDIEIFNFEVSALINAGIVRYLEEQQTLHKWLSSIDERFRVKIRMDKSGYTVYGSLKDMSTFEHYLENHFPTWEDSEHNIEKKHVSVKNEEYIEMSEVEFEYICHLRKYSPVLSTVESLSYDSGRLKATGLYNIKNKIRNILSSANRETVVFKTTTDAERKLKNYKTDSNESTDLVLTQTRNQICIMGEAENVTKAFCCLSSMNANVFEISMNNLTLEVMQGDIRNANANFIAVSSTPTMWSQQGAGKHICEMLGDKYDQACRSSVDKEGTIRFGECRVIETGLCVRKWIGNVSIPASGKSQTHNIEQFVLRDAYSTCFSEADERHCSTMAMTIIGSDISRGGFPLQNCADLMCQALLSFKPKHLTKILVVEFDVKKYKEIVELISIKSRGQRETMIY
ncbi:uncharacterized protein LOC127841511 isoform X1 [Dreissena polymorpha]|nr:uncharacterized protein LOC127841511 isoform X1 [Dreissena polymorpha]